MTNLSSAECSKVTSLVHQIKTKPLTVQFEKCFGVKFIRIQSICFFPHLFQLIFASLQIGYKEKLFKRQFSVISLHYLCIMVSQKGLLYFLISHMANRISGIFFQYLLVILSLDRKAQGKRECKGNACSVERSTCNIQSWPHSPIQKQWLKGAGLFCLSQSKWYCDAVPCRHSYSFEYCSGFFLMNFSVFVRILAANNVSVQKEWELIQWGL